MSALFNLKSRDYLHDPDKKKHFNRELFTEVAPQYDFITRVLSLGRDGAWKRHLVAALPAVEAPVCVDLACGTGDICFLLAGRYPKGEITGLDLTGSMVALARERNRYKQVQFQEADMGETGLEDQSVDIVTGGYALRNAPDLSRALVEIARILKPGGTAAFLDFSRPVSRAGQGVTHALLKTWGSFWGLLIHGRAEVYGYIAESLKRYPDRNTLRRMIDEAGFDHPRGRLFYGGLLEMILFDKR